MIVYRDHKRRLPTNRQLSVIDALARRMESGTPGWDEATDLLVETGEFESGFTDALCPNDDTITPDSESVRELGIGAGRIFSAVVNGHPEALRARLLAFRERIRKMVALRLPPVIQCTVPEGYAYYGLYPDQYAAAAHRYFAGIGRREAVCVGIRSIGAGLSAVVAATLEEHGCAVDSCTVRPRGEYFDRSLSTSAGFDRWIRARSGADFLIIDEGPGLSGSSFGCVAAKLAELGIGDEQVFFFPSWLPDGRGLLCETARSRWAAHRKFCVSFEELWLDSGRLQGCFPGAELLDLSAGRWRRFIYEREADFPAVHPSSERRKYLLVPHGRTITPADLHETGRSGGDLPALTLLKFCGLGKYGRSTRERAELLAKAGFSTPVTGAACGFIAYRFIPGAPLSPGRQSRHLIDVAARYSAFIRERCRAEESCSVGEIVGMIEENVAEKLGREWLSRIGRLVESMRGMHGGACVAIDGRMLPHEWIETGRGLLKVDATDHHADHFFPGCQDIAWDLAGCSVEFNLGDGHEHRLIETYAALSGDAAIGRRMGFYTLAYCAFRLGFASLMADLLSAEPDGARFRRLAGYYGDRVKSMAE